MLEVIRNLRLRGWIFTYSAGTKYVGAEHPYGGRMSVAEIRLPVSAGRDEFGEFIADALNNYQTAEPPGVIGKCEIIRCKTGLPGDKISAENIGDGCFSVNICARCFELFGDELPEPDEVDKKIRRRESLDKFSGK